MKTPKSKFFFFKKCTSRPRCRDQFIALNTKCSCSTISHELILLRLASALRRSFFVLVSDVYLNYLSGYSKLHFSDEK